MPVIRQLKEIIMPTTEEEEALLQKAREESVCVRRRDSDALLMRGTRPVGESGKEGERKRRARQETEGKKGRRVSVNSRSGCGDSFAESS